jgi:hypothetical protein
MTVTTLIFVKLTLVQHFVKNNIRFHENSTNHAVTDTRSQTDTVSTYSILFTLQKMPKKVMFFKCKANNEDKNLLLPIFHVTMKCCSKE